MGRYGSVPMTGKQSLDLDDYVTDESLDGLFYMVRTGPGRCERVRRDLPWSGKDASALGRS